MERLKRFERLERIFFKAPWYGYELGYWSERNREEAELALQSKHFEIGARAKAERKNSE